MVVAYDKRFKGREREVVVCNDVLPPTQAMDLLDIRTLPSYNKLLALCEEKVSSRKEMDEDVLYKAVVEACQQGDVSFDTGIMDALIRRVSSLEATLVEIRERSRSRIEYLEFQLKARRRETRKRAIKVLLSGKD